MAKSVVKIRLIPHLLRTHFHVHHDVIRHRLNSVLVVGLLFASGLATASTYSLHWTPVMAAGFSIDPDVESDFNLAQMLGKVKDKVNCNEMLAKFQRMKGKRHDSISLDFFKKLFQSVGLDDEMAESVFQIMDWNHSGTLEPHEVAAVLTLFESPEVHDDKVSHFRFLFRCMDLDCTGSVSRETFRKMLTAMLKAKYHLTPKHELLKGVKRDEYHAVATYEANKLVQEIFIFADQDRDDKLNLKEFIRWAWRGTPDVVMIGDLLKYTVGGKKPDVENTFKYY